MAVEYHSYMASRDWALKKQKVRERSGGVCERCKRGDHEQTHHLTYERLGEERLTDLLGVCALCHEYLSGKSDRDPAEPGATLVPPVDDSLFEKTDTPWKDLVYKADSKGVWGDLLHTISNPFESAKGKSLSALDWKIALLLLQRLTLGEAEKVWLGSPLGFRGEHSIVGKDAIAKRRLYARNLIWKAHLAVERQKSYNQSDWGR